MDSALIGNTHLVAGSGETVPLVLKLLLDHGFQTKQNPDLYIRTYPQVFGIEEARELKARAALGPIASERRIFIAAAPGMTNEAQNALLKTIEEPPGGALFFFIVPSPHALLSTIRSRAQIIHLEAKERSELVDAPAFLAASVQKRLDMIKPLLEKDVDDKRDSGAILSFLSSLERTLFEATGSGSSEGFGSIYRARKYISDRGALVKPLLEQIVLLTPRM